MSEELEFEDWKDYAGTGIIAVTSVIGMFFISIEILKIIQQILTVIPSVVMEAHKIAYVNSDPLWLGFIYGIIFSAIIVAVKNQEVV